MHWIAPSERDTASDTLEKRLWNAADQFRANSGLTAAQYSAPVLGLIFLLFAETRFAQCRAQLLPSPTGGGGTSRRSSRADEPAAYHAEGVIFLPQAARFAHLLNLPEGAKSGRRSTTRWRKSRSTIRNWLACCRAPTTPTCCGYNCSIPA
ncbi:MAG: type I restriction-modification system subunit M N-terminal domain-containing protein [Gallionella sp.]|nr:type I restriction-modification system subunit M N-terminal domain-containing protein [Gallionella sp.]